jgi:hypothetical protein
MGFTKEEVLKMFQDGVGKILDELGLIFYLKSKDEKKIPVDKAIFVYKALLVGFMVHDLGGLGEILPEKIKEKMKKGGENNGNP